MQKVMNITNPRVALANIGTEDHKGGELQHETFALLKNSNLNFVGNIEARDIPLDAGEVIVADGFTGNVILKTYEGVAIMIEGISFTIKDLVQGYKPIHPDTIAAYNQVVLKYKS